MNVNEFLNRCEDSWGAKVKLMPARQAIYMEKLRRFSSEQLSAIYDKVLETTGRFPEIKDIYAVARELGYLETEQAKCTRHHWQESECGSCHGEGRLCIVWSARVESRPTGLLELQRLEQVLQYTRSFEYQLKPGEFRTIFRCKCFAGDTPTLSRGWPKLTNSTPIEREVWV